MVQASAQDLRVKKTRDRKTWRKAVRIVQSTELGRVLRSGRMNWVGC